MYYNRKVFEDFKLSIPKTWDQLLATCEKIKPSGITPLYLAGKDTWTFELIPQVFGLMDYEGRYSEYNQKYHNFEIKNSDRKNYIDGMYKMKDLVIKGLINATYLSDTHSMAQEALTSGNAAMYVGLGSLSARLVNAFPDKYKDIGAFAVPVDNDGNKDYICQEIGKVLAATDKNKDVARVKELFNYLASKEVQLAYFEKNPDLPVSNLLSSDEVNLPPSLKDILDLRNGENVVIEPGLTNVFSSGVDIPTGLSQILATDNYKPENLMKEIDDGLAKDAKK
jgi:raffinose/stachyose/melibiose transport system substrate-binding protein